MQKYSDTVQDRNGNVVVGATVTVKTYPAGTTATVYSSDSTSGSSANPLTTDANGYFEFWAPNGQYSLTVTKAGLTTRTVSNILIQDAVVSVVEYGAKGNGSDDTAAFVAAMANPDVFIPPGNYSVGSIAWPSTCKRLRGAGIGATTLTATGSVATSASILSVASVSGVEIAGFTLVLDGATYTTQFGIGMNTVTNAYVHDIDITKGGSTAIRADGCTDILVQHVRVANWLNRGIDFSVGTNTRITVDQCYVPGTGTQLSHNIGIANGVDCAITNCYTSNNVVGSFGGVLYNIVRGRISGNISYNGVAEGFNFQNVDSGVMANNVVYASASSTDFGLSFFGDGVAGGTVKNCVMSGNTIYQPGKAGIALASQVVGCLVVGNKIYNANQNDEAQWGGITLYGGTGCNHNVVKDNFVYDTTSKTNYAANEYNDGTGDPNSNQLLDNPVSAGGLTAETALLGAASITSQVGWSSWTSTVTATSGTITTVGAKTTQYRIRGKTAEVQYDIVITTNGTGASAIQFTLPPGFNAATNGGVLAGREIINTGSNTSAQCNGTGALIRTYNNGYPAADGAQMIGSGIYRIA